MDGDSMSQTIDNNGEGSPHVYATEQERMEAYQEFQQEQNKVQEKQSASDAQHAEEYQNLLVLESEVDEKVQAAIRHAEQEIRDAESEIVVVQETLGHKIE